MTTFFASVMKFPGKYNNMPMCLSSFHVRKEQPIYDEIAFLYFTCIRFGENNSLNLVLIAVAHEYDW